LNELLSEIHEFSSVLLTVLVVMHIGGALLHLFKPGDRLFRRMLPW
jgi:cytochrome b561